MRGGRNYGARTIEAMSSLEVLRGAKRIGFLFSGGSSRTIFQVGVVETLFELGIEPAMCLGVSAGSWNAAAVSVGNWRRLRPYWRFFCRMPYIDVRNMLREHSPFIWSRLHERAFKRYVNAAKIGEESALPLLVALTRLRDKTSVVLDARTVADPFRLLLAGNYLPPFYTHPVEVDGERYGDGGYTNNIPYETLFEAGCDAVVLMASKGESEGGLYRNPDDYEHEMPAMYRDRVVVIRPRHRMPLRFTERRWTKLLPIAEMGRLRAREVLLGERHPECDAIARGTAVTLYAARVRNWLKRSRRRPAVVPQSP
jgi:predicted acylesterase/phospholipase RssA